LLTRRRVVEYVASRPVDEKVRRQVVHTVVRLVFALTSRRVERSTKRRVCEKVGGRLGWYKSGGGIEPSL